MREIWLDHSEVINSTEILLVFKAKFNRQEYGTYTIINLASRIDIQNDFIKGCVEALEGMNREAAREAEPVE